MQVVAIDHARSITFAPEILMLFSHLKKKKKDRKEDEKKLRNINSFVVHILFYVLYIFFSCIWTYSVEK